MLTPDSSSLDLYLEQCFPEIEPILRADVACAGDLYPICMTRATPDPSPLSYRTYLDERGHTDFAEEF